jgi:23S rRNA (pseudouridine1915-N3)-methyltransferase
VTEIVILAIGAKHQPHVLELVSEYQARLSRNYKISWKILEPGVSKEAEGQSILKQIQDGDEVWLLDEVGELVTSEQLSKKLDNWRTRSRRLCVIIGGAYGASKDVSTRANHVLAFGKLTYPHQLVRILVMEQLYRAQAIIDNLPYHHA